ncbi:MAG: extracellular solute-binding protein family 5 [Candidatus Rokubacteria bacterium]|nr:extracellular solute-binding protein family 5 [Candidatus Rokubacteria bacterium]
MRFLKFFMVLAALLAPALPAAAQTRMKAEEVVVAFAAEPRTLLPVTIVDWTTNNMVEHMYDRLVDRDPKTYKPIPMLATSWKVVDNTTWEFSLRSGVKFHNGEPFDAQSVKATMDYIKDPANKTHYASRWSLVKEVQIVDPYTVRFITEKPWPGLIDRISASDMLVMPPKALRAEGPQGLLAKPVGTGPFKFSQWVRDEKLVVVRNDDYWKGKPELKTVTFRFIPEFSARLAALLAGEIDIMKDVPPHAVDLVDRSGKATVRATVSSRINYLALVTLKPGPMQDIRVRQAISHAINVDELIQQVLRGRASKMCGPLSPINVDFSPKVQCLKHDVKQAQALLKSANIDPGRLVLTLDTPSGRYPLDKDISQAIASQLGRIGITANVVVNEWGTHLDKIKNRATGDMFFLGWGPALDAQGTIEQLFQGSMTYSSYGGNKLLEDKIATAITIVDPKKRLEAWADIQQMVANEAPWVFLWQQHDLYGVANWIDWQPRADEKVWMYEAKIAKR